MKKLIKSCFEKINIFFTQNEKLSYILGRVSAYILLFANVILSTYYKHDLLIYILQAIINISFLLCIYFNFYIKNTIKI